MPKHDPFDDKINLHVYKASAGSGKTHRLTGEYLLLLFASPYAYKYILAVTFTNKATDEMKKRIITELAKIALGQASAYVDSLCLKYAINEEKLRLQARETLERILHDYSSFSVNTIDKFFQQTMRAFTREIGLGGGYRVELDTSMVLSEAIEIMLYDLEHSENKDLLNWLIRFSEEKIENGETWNIRSDIQTLAKEIFKESYKTYSNQVQANISDKQLMENYKKMLFGIIQIFDSTTQQIGEKGLLIMGKFGLKPDDFKMGSRSPFFYFLKAARGEGVELSKTFKLLANDIALWYIAKTPVEIKNSIEAAYPQLNECVCELIAHHDNILMYQTAYEINRYFFTLGILGDVDKNVRAYAAEHNVMLISDTTELLNRIIAGNESPFVYEKVGMRVNHYMIDEFQDTSGMQWQNFQPLVRDSLASGNTNFIVGDVKQSIYRWRNSDWKLLDEQIDKDFSIEGIHHETLNTNWRSSRHVIEFNNAIFSQGAKLLQDAYNNNLDEREDKRLQPFLTRITKAYSEVYQYMPKNHAGNDGHVRIEFIDTEEYNWQDQVLDQLPSHIEQLQDKGYKLKDIAILVRTKKEGVEVANSLLAYKSQHPNSSYRYDIISDEALFVANAKSVKLIASLLKYLHNPSDNSLKALAIYEYFKYNNQLNAADALQKYFSTKDEFPIEVLKELNRIRQLPLYEMTEEMFELFYQAMETNEQVYIQSFLDMVLDFTVRNSSDLDAFLHWWEETGIKKTIFTPDGQDAMRIMTIHKSKGLEFNVVLIPFCNWEIDHKMPTILWCRPQVAPFNGLHLVPVKYSKNLKNTIFDYEYFDERLHAFIDNINVLYVAFTRAKNELIAFSPKPKPKKKEEEVNSIASLLWACMHSSDDNEDNKPCINLSQYIEEKTNVFEIGYDYQHTKSERKKSNTDVQEIEIDMLPSIPFDKRLSLLLSNKYFFSNTGKRDYGTLMHEIVSKIDTIQDIKTAVEPYYIRGEIDSLQKREVIELLYGYLSNDAVSRWYSGEYKVLNEVQILQPDGTFVRPDRVMLKEQEAIVIDYKFGEKEDTKYIRQVKSYTNQLKKMGYAPVKGYICYITLGKIVEVL